MVFICDFIYNFTYIHNFILGRAAGYWGQENKVYKTRQTRPQALTQEFAHF